MAREPVEDVAAPHRPHVARPIGVEIDDHRQPLVTDRPPKARVQPHAVARRHAQVLVANRERWLRRLRSHARLLEAALSGADAGAKGGDPRRRRTHAAVKDGNPNELTGLRRRSAVTARPGTPRAGEIARRRGPGPAQAMPLMPP